MSGKKEQESALIEKFNRIGELTEGEKACLLDIEEHYETIDKGKDFIRQGQQGIYTYLLLDGWAYSYQVLSNGKRQVISFFIKADFIGLVAGNGRPYDHSVRSLTSCKMCRLSHDQVYRIFQQAPRLAFTIASTIRHHNAILHEHVVRIGNRNAYSRTGHFLLELLNRIEMNSTLPIENYEFPISQNLLADTLGLTPVHINRTMRKLQSDNLIDYDRDRIYISDRNKLAEMVGFDKAYLAWL